MSHLSDIAHAYLMERARAEEMYCEMSLTDPHGRGVMITEWQDMSYRIELSDTVPWGEIHVHKKLGLPN